MIRCRHPSSRPRFSEVLRRLFGKRAFVHLTIGVTLAAFALYGSTAFTVPFLLRGGFGLDLGEAAAGFGVFGGVAAATGVALGGALTDWAGKRDPRYYALIPGAGFCVAAPLFSWAFVQDDLVLLAAFIGLPLVLQNLFFGPTYAITHNLVEARMRATATAILFLPATFVGLGFGPPVVGWLSDVIATNTFSAGMHSADLASGAFATLCPGGTASPGASADLTAACSVASFTGVKWAIVFTLASVYPLAGLFYFLSARTLPRDMGLASSALPVRGVNHA